MRSSMMPSFVRRTISSDEMWISSHVPVSPNNWTCIER